jgi:hypothetical protein
MPVGYRDFRFVTARAGSLDPLMGKNRIDRSTCTCKFQFKVAGTVHKFNKFANRYFYHVFQMGTAQAESRPFYHSSGR